MKLRVYYADTDAGGVVYYANYLRWLEMARCELVEDLGRSVVEYAREGFIFAVVRVEVDYHVPAVLGDRIEVKTTVQRVRRVRFLVEQQVVRCTDGEKLVTAGVTVACVSPQRKVLALPEDLATALQHRVE